MKNIVRISMDTMLIFICVQFAIIVITIIMYSYIYDSVFQSMICYKYMHMTRGEKSEIFFCWEAGRMELDERETEEKNLFPEGMLD